MIHSTRWLGGLRCLACLASACAMLATLPMMAWGQMINVETPFTTSSDSSFERFGVGFGFRFPAGRGSGSRVVGLGPQGQLLPFIGFQQSAGGIPPFGGYNPASGAQFGFRRIGRNGGGFSLAMNLAQGSQRTNVTSAPSLTVMNGGSGYFFHGATRPFVTSVVPVLGNHLRPVPPPVDNAVTRAIASGALNSSRGLSLGQQRKSVEPPPGRSSFPVPQSTANQAAASVSQIKQQRQAWLDAQQDQILAKLRAGDAALANGDPVLARMEYRSVLSIDDSPQIRKLVKQRIEESRQPTQEEPDGGQ